MKILAKRKRGNKFPLREQEVGAQVEKEARQGTKKETNPRLNEAYLVRVCHRGKEEIGS